MGFLLASLEHQFPKGCPGKKRMPWWFWIGLEVLRVGVPFLQHLVQIPKPMQATDWGVTRKVPYDHLSVASASKTSEKRPFGLRFCQCQTPGSFCCPYPSSRLLLLWPCGLFNRHAWVPPGCVLLSFRALETAKTNLRLLNKLSVQGNPAREEHRGNKDTKEDTNPTKGESTKKKISQRGDFPENKPNQQPLNLWIDIIPSNK